MFIVGKGRKWKMEIVESGRAEQGEVLGAKLPNLERNLRLSSGHRTQNKGENFRRSDLAKGVRSSPKFIACPWLEQRGSKAQLVSFRPDHETNTRSFGRCHVFNLVVNLLSKLNWRIVMTSQKVINAPRQGKRKPRFSLSEEQKAANGLFATLSKKRPNL